MLKKINTVLTCNCCCMCMVLQISPRDSNVRYAKTGFLHTFRGRKTPQHIFGTVNGSEVIHSLESLNKP